MGPPTALRGSGHVGLCRSLLVLLIAGCLTQPTPDAKEVTPPIGDADASIPADAALAFVVDGPDLTVGLADAVNRGADVPWRSVDAPWRDAPLASPPPCEQLSSGQPPEMQIAIVEADGSRACTDRLVDGLEHAPEAFLEAFLTLAGRARVSSSLFYSTYAEMANLRFGAAVVDALTSGLPLAVAQLAEPGLRANWESYVLGGLARGAFYRCPVPLPVATSQLLTVLPYGDYDCTELLAVAFAEQASAGVVDELIRVTMSPRGGWSRRNAWRVLGRFATAATASSARAAVEGRASQLRTAAFAALANELDDDALHDVIWLLDSGFYPTLAALAPFEGLALRPDRSSALRFRAAAATTRLIAAIAGTIPATEADFLVAALVTDDYWVRAQAAYTVASVAWARANQSFAAADDERIGALLVQRYAVEPALVARAYIAQALDGRDGGHRLESMRSSYETEHLAIRRDGLLASVWTGLSSADADALAALLEEQSGAFHALFGADFDAPVPSDPNSRVTVAVFATRDEYQEYMSTFVGYGASAGGLYLERLGTLYTFQRSAAESSYTLTELLQHEFTHYLQGRFVYPGLWGDPGYFDEARGWADEGLAEVFAGLEFSANGSFDIAAIRPRPLDRLCQAGTGSLASLLAQRAGYDELGVFDYDRSWLFVRWLAVARRSSFLDIYRAWRGSRYRLDDLALLAGASVSELEVAWAADLANLCAAR